MKEIFESIKDSNYTDLQKKALTLVARNVQSSEELIFKLENNPQ